MNRMIRAIIGAILVLVIVFSAISISSFNTTRWIQVDGKFGDFILYCILYTIINIIVGGIIILILLNFLLMKIK